MSGSFSFITSNLSLLGYNSEYVGFYQSIIELLENSVDACNKVYLISKRATNILILIGSYGNDQIEVQVIDDGEGIENLITVLESFQTTKLDIHSHSIGKFGIGLTATLAYSVRSSNLPCRIITKRRMHSYSEVIDVLFNATGQPVVIQNSSFADNKMESGTLVKLYMKAIDTTSQEFKGMI